MDDLRLAELLAALSVATDLGMGNEPEKAIRSCLVATELARSMGLTEAQCRDVYYASMVLHLGCTAPSHELGRIFGDDLGVTSRGEYTDDSTLRGSLAVLGLVGRGTGLRRAGHLARVLAAGEAGSGAILRAVCDVGTRLADRLHLGAGVVSALRDSTEVWDGSSGASGRSEDDIALPARFALVATQAVIFDRLGGPDAAVEVVRERAGHWFDPAIAATFLRVGPDLLQRLDQVDVWVEVLDAEPGPGRRVPGTQLDAIAAVFADVADLKSTFTLGHSPEVARLAAAAGQGLGLPDERVDATRHAGLLHDLGRVAVSVGVWERPRALTSTQWEQVRLHPYHSARILTRSSVLAPLAPIAGMHHERQDGSGYHHAAAGPAIPVEARLLAAADAFQAMTQERAHRAALADEEAAARLEADASSGRLDVECVRAVVAAAGQRTTRRGGPWPAGLTDREVQVLRLLARGSTNRGIAAELVISPRTAEHHVQHIYGKIGGSTRAAAALFAVEHGLIGRPT